MDKTGFSIKSIGGKKLRRPTLHSPLGTEGRSSFISLAKAKIVLSIMVLVLLSIIPAAAGEGNLKEVGKKQQVIHEVAQKWIEVGREQYNRGLYKQANQSLLFAQDYQESLTDAERQQLKMLLDKVGAAMAERERIIDDINRGNALAKQGQLIKAKVHFERLREATTLTKEEQKLATEGLKNVNQQLSEQKKEIDELYRQSMDLYAKGEIEKAREGFSKIDNILAMMAAHSTETTENKSITVSDALITEKKEADEAMRGLVEEETEKVKKADVDTEKAVDAEEAKEPNEFSAVSEPPKYESGGSEMTADRKGNILRSYTKAVVSDATARAQSYISDGSFEQARQVIEDARQTVSKNQNYLGDDLFQQYTSQLERLTEEITKKQNTRN